MSLVDAVVRTGVIPLLSQPQAIKKRYSEVLSKNLAVEVAGGLRASGFRNVRPLPDGRGEKEFQGGLGPKKVDVSYSDEWHGLLLAVSIKSICFPEYGKNLKNRFADLCTEAITLHLRFPYSVVCALFAFPVGADEDVTRLRPISTFRRATQLLATISGRQEYTDPGEKFENVTMMLFKPVTENDSAPWVKLFDAKTGTEIDEATYFHTLRRIYNLRNPHAAIGDVGME